MRLWSLHPSYLDSLGLVAAWREGLLARKVLQGATKGYRNHPQLQRFRVEPDPVATLDCYLAAILEEADRRSYAFDCGKIDLLASAECIPVTNGQLEYELAHLRGKLLLRNPPQYEKVAKITLPLPNPIFRVIKGGIEPWERTKN
jgi:hypothetical protein